MKRNTLNISALESNATENIKESRESRCMYCGSTSYGTGCVFASHSRHVHVDDPTRCIYCGLLAYGSGCIFNPFSRVHIHGADVGQTIKETFRKTVELSYITDRLFTATEKTEAYKLGLINKEGKILRPPETAYEQRLISPLNITLNQIKKFINTDAALIIESLKLINNSNITEESVQDFKNSLEFKEELSTILRDLRIVISKHINVLSLESLEKNIEEVLLNTINYKNE